MLVLHTGFHSEFSQGGWGGGGGKIMICQYKRGKNIGDAVMFL